MDGRYLGRRVGGVPVMRAAVRRRVLRVCLLVDLLAVAFWVGVLVGGEVTAGPVLALAGACGVAAAAGLHRRGRGGRS